MSYDQCGKRWSETCPEVSRHPIGGSAAHFCSKMVASDGDDCGGPHECNCGEKLGDAPKRRAMSPAVQAMVIGAAILGGGASGPMSLTREEREIRRAASRGSSRMQNERIAAAQAKRQRKAIKRSPAPPSGEVPSSVTSINND